MPTSPTDEPPLDGTLLVFADGAGGLGDWLLLGDDGGVTRGSAADGLPPVAEGRVALAAPGEEVAIHWLVLEEGLAPAQAVAAARLMLADASLTPIAEAHVAVGAAEGGKTPVAIVPNERMEAWLASATAAGIDPDPVMPTPMLLPVPAEGLARRARGAVADHRGIGAAFAIEPDLAGALAGGAAVTEVDEAAFAAGLAETLAAPPLNLRQGAFARRRRGLRIVEGSWRRLAVYGAVIGALTLLIQIVTIMSYTFAADRLEAETAAFGQPGGPAVRGGFGPMASPLFEAVRSTPSAELTAIDYRGDGMTGAIRVDNPATFAAFRARAEASGLRLEVGAAPAGGIAEFRVRR